jgi:hypothetical protein
MADHALPRLAADYLYPQIIEFKSIIVFRRHDNRNPQVERDTYD